MDFRQSVFDLICDVPGITRVEIDRRLEATRPWWMLPFVLRIRRAITVGNLVIDGEVNYVDGKDGIRHYYVADRGRWTDHALAPPTKPNTKTEFLRRCWRGPQV